MEWTLEFPAPAPVWSTNADRQIHWGKRKRLVEEWREATAWHAKAQKIRGIGPATVRVTLFFQAKARRDPHNYTGTVVKAIVDGLVVAKAWPDDTPDWVSVAEPVLLVDKTLRRPAARVTITERKDDDRFADGKPGGVRGPSPGRRDHPA